MCFPNTKLSGFVLGSIAQASQQRIQKQLRRRFAAVQITQKLALAEAHDEGGGVVVRPSPLLHDALGDAPRSARQARPQVAAGGDAVAHQAVDVAVPHLDRHDLGGAHVVADDAGETEDARRLAVQRLDLDVADAAEGAGAAGVDLEDADRRTARGAQLLVADRHDLGDAQIEIGADHLRRLFSGHPRLVAMAETVDHCREGAASVFDLFHDEAVTTNGEPLERPAVTTHFHLSPRNTHITVVPRPGAVSRLNSSTSFLTATSPLPMPRCDLSVPPQISWSFLASMP